jgi:hypothetical protein
MKLENTVLALNACRLPTLNLNMKFETQCSLNEDILIPIPRFPIIDLAGMKMSVEKRVVPLLSSEVGFTKLSPCLPFDLNDYKEDSIFN